MAGRNLYENTSFFQLIIGGIIHQIWEPVNWDKITIELPRDKDSFAFNFEFVDDSIQLGFANDNEAYDLVKAVYDTVGSDGIIVFQYGYMEPHSIIRNVQFTGNVNLNTYVNENGQITCAVEKQTFENLVKTRFETLISLADIKTLDGEDITPLTPDTIKLHSKKISKQFLATISDSRSANSAPISRFMSVQIDTSEAQTSEIEQNQGLPLGISGTDPRDDDRYFFKILETGDYTLNVQVAFTLRIVCGLPGGVGDYNVAPRFMVRRSGGTIEYIDFNDFRQSGTTGSFQKILTFNYNFSLERNWLSDDQLFLDVNGNMENAGATYLYYVTNYNSSVQMLGQTTAPETTAKGYKPISVITKLVQYATGRSNAVISSLLDIGGPMYKTFLINGYSIRNFMVADKPLTTSIKDFLDSICAIGGLGYGFKTVAGVDYLIIEPYESFFNDEPIGMVDNISDYREENAKDLVFNEFELGYDKFAEDELNSLDEFNTYQTGLTPIKTQKLKFTRKSKYITSGYLLEKQRREQFAENPSESLSNDDDIFVVSCNVSHINNATSYTADPETNRFAFTRELDLADGDLITIVGGNNGSNNNLTYTIVGKVPVLFETYEVSGDPVSIDGGKILLRTYIGAGEIRAEKDEAFEVVTGLFSPETAYNLRYSPARMKWNWAQLMSIGFDKKPDTDLVRTTFVKNNDKMRSLLSALDPGRRNEPLIPFGESENVPLSIFRGDNRAPKHKPLFCYFKADMDYEAFSYIKTRAIGESGDVNDRGWIYFKDDSGIFIKGFIYNLKYQPGPEVAEFQVAKIGNY